MLGGTVFAVVLVAYFSSPSGRPAFRSGSSLDLDPSGNCVCAPLALHCAGQNKWKTVNGYGYSRFAELGHSLRSNNKLSFYSNKDF